MQAEGEGIIRRLSGEVVVAVPLIRARAERSIVAGLLRRLDIEADTLDRRPGPELNALGLGAWTVAEPDQCSFCGRMSLCRYSAPGRPVLPPGASAGAGSRVVVAAATALLVAGCDSGSPRAPPRRPTTAAVHDPGHSTHGSRRHRGPGEPTRRRASYGAACGRPAAGLRAVVAKVRPQVVEISTSAGLGSGVIYDHQGDIVTNDHVVGSATTFTVHLVDGQSLGRVPGGRLPAR